MKVCSRCKKRKRDNQFRFRYDKRGRGSKALVYLNNTCRKCDSEIQNKNYFKNKDNPEFRKKWVDKSREYYYAHKEEIKEKMRLKRQTPEYKAMMKAYRQKRKDIIREQEIITKKRYHEKHRDNLTDTYIIRQLANQKIADKHDLVNHPEIIEAKRLQILIKRKINQNGNKN